MVIDTTSDPSHSEPSPRCTNCTDRGAPCGGAASPACLSLVTNEVPSNATTRMTQGYRHSVQFSPTEDCIPETTYHDIDWGLHPRLDPTYDKPSNRTHRQRQILSLIKSNRELIEYEEDFDGIVYDDNPYDLPAATKQEDPNDLVSKIRFYGPDPPAGTPSYTVPRVYRHIHRIRPAHSSTGGTVEAHRRPEPVAPPQE